MGNRTVVGVGCFGRPETLLRLFDRVMSDYALGEWDIHRCRCRHGGNVSRLFQDLLSRGDGRPCLSASREPPDWEEKEVVGFYVALAGARLELSVFARGARSRPERYTSSLDFMTRLRRTRLN